ncbi:PspC domain-containing protein [Paenibacillus pasadenensis]|uniref:PspC domain-containing protein n=1 Tax=Paenibacillus pasadenensis TaxID=217090 RepID=UPI00203F73F4|nr:PspC domain-containing protein [Paenibacillus pasadenensis]MCM3749733.1 PspC domain-containing protein [Paenibacillus pasadenensis]
MKQLYRSRHKKIMAGLCGGLSDYFNVDANLLRILVIILTICTSGAVILVYILAALVIPKEPVYNDYPPGGFGPYGGYNDPGRGYQEPRFGRGEGRGRQQGPYGGPYRNPSQFDGGNAGQQWGAETEPTASELDKMMDDLEKKALRKELEEVKAKLSKYEKGE